MAKYSELFDARKKAENQKSGNMENQTKKVKPAANKLVNLGIKVDVARRRHWVGQAKLQGLTISEVIIEALENRFGVPG